jgi:aminopeptidase S
LDQRGVEPLAMKIFAGIVLLVIGLGIGIGVFSLAATGSQQLLAFNVTLDGQFSLSTTIGIPTEGDNSKTIQVSVTKLGTYDKTVTLDATGEPTGVTVSFSPASGTPDLGSTMTVVVDNNATAGATTITVKATGSDATQKSATLSLTLA